MLFFIIVGLVFFGLTFLLNKYKEKLQEQYKKQWKKAINYIRYTSLTILLAGVLYVPGAQILMISGWLLIFSLILYFSSLYLIFNKNRT